jgi:hypothetical protein
MTIQQAIQLAIKGGYNGFEKPFCPECGNYESPNNGCGNNMFLDLKFWQCLGKAMEWNEGCNYFPGVKQKGEWIFKWHEFILNLVDGYSIEDYFKKIDASNPSET